MKAVSTLRSLSEEDLNKKLNQLRVDLVKKASSTSTGVNSKNSSEVKNIKKTIARILTLLNEKRK